MGRKHNGRERSVPKVLSQITRVEFKKGQLRHGSLHLVCFCESLVSNWATSGQIIAIVDMQRIWFG